MALTSLVHRDEDADTLIVTNMWPVEGRPSYGIFVKRQVDSLIAAGLRCDVLMIHGYRSKLAYAAAAIRIGLMRARGGSYALVHAHGGESIVAARWYWPGALVVSYCGDDLLGTPDRHGRVSAGSRIRRSLMRFFSRLANRTITKSAEMERVLPAAVQARNSVIPNGVDSEVFMPIERAEARERLSWDSREPVALFAADPAVRNKNYDLAREACELVRGHGVPVRLHVASGIDPELMPIVIGASDCLLLTSTSEGSPNVVKEALLCNLPVVATDVGDVSEQLRDVEPSWITNPTPEEVGGALAEALTGPTRSNGRDIAGKRLDQRLVAQRILGLYGELRGAGAV